MMLPTWRRSDQGRTDRRRSNAPPPGCRGRLLRCSTAQKSIAIDLHQPAGAGVARKLAASAMSSPRISNPGPWQVRSRLRSCRRSTARDPCSHKASCRDHEHRTARRGRADDGRSCLMTGRPGDPLRAVRASTTSWRSLRATGALGALIQRASARGMECNRRCSRTTSFWSASTCCSTQ